MIALYDYQLDAIHRMRTGCILCGGVGSGKSLTALGYYYLQNGGEEESLRGEDYIPMDDVGLQDLYIITTAHKRDTLEWEGEMTPFLLSTKPEVNLYRNKVVVDSWNNIRKYVDVKGAFFIFDEQRVVGSGAWVKAFLKITKANDWVLLSATPGDTWQDYIPVFIANGFYKNRTEFIRRHIVYSRAAKYPKVDRYLETGRLIRLRNRILVDMNFHRDTVSHHEDILVSYDVARYRKVGRTRWDPYKDEPIQQASGLCYVWRKIVNLDESRLNAVLRLSEAHSRPIIFYNFDYELDALKALAWPEGFTVAEWNGHKHQPIPDTEKWAYLVQYNAGCEGWNCTMTDTIIFYSQSYSYKTMIQAAGRIDRLTTPYRDLWYYHLRSQAGIDRAIWRALRDKKNFNETKYCARIGKET